MSDSRIVGLTTRPGIVDLKHTFTSDKKRVSAHLANLGVARVCEGSALDPKDIPPANELFTPGSRFEVVHDAAGIPRKIGPIAVEGGELCILLDPFRQNVEGIPLQNTGAIVSTVVQKAS